MFNIPLAVKCGWLGKVFGRKIQHSSPVKRKSFAAVIFDKEREKDECFREIGVFYGY